MIFLEDTRIGVRQALGSYTFTADAIKAFARAYDPQAFHLDEGAGERSLFGGLAASGWHTASVYMKLLVAYLETLASEAKACGEEVAASGPSPGFKNLKWPRPVLAGDTISYFYEATSMRPLASRPGWGIVFGTTTAVNQRDELVLFFENSVFLRRRSL
ncbi:MaoC family dehydratase [Bradyrhizobium sp. LHD-71]|uniref:MaoC family dehydratase n=1 Tax=Bradyrhizobium sp. LHD-71 TaxID=3072141 RepID=UPI00280D957E|nr:MaoC family dehydratase [Bradyrhizobium sp. LHD-71]MDQ8729040.1 MaoC family dehydratase [Bradyrhizobium sp. LHD-71]